MDTATTDEVQAEAAETLVPTKEPEAVEDEHEQQEELLIKDEPAPAADILPPAAPTAEEKMEVEREKDRRRFEARRSGRMYFVRHPRAPEDPGAAQLPLARLCAGLLDLPRGSQRMLLCSSGDLQTKGIETEMEAYQVQMRVLNESINLKKVQTL